MRVTDPILTLHLGYVFALGLSFSLGYVLGQAEDAGRGFIPNAGAATVQINDNGCQCTGDICHCKDVYVLHDINDYEYWLRMRNNDETHAVFCPDPKLGPPLFSRGQTLKDITYQDRGACWSLANMHPAYLIRKDENGNPILQ